MGKYRKRPIVVEAFQMGNFHRTDSVKEDFLGWATKHGLIMPAWWWDWDGLHILSPENEMVARSTDWIIKGIEGEFYTCRDSIFTATYEKTEE